VVRTWVRALGAALAAAVVSGAGQLGIAYGLGILRWDQRFPADVWKAHLVWVAWIGALAVVAGAVAGARTLPRPTFGSWLAVSLAGMVGAAVTVPLVALPARAAQVPPPLDPALNAGLAASIGVLVGLFAALAVLCARPVAGSVLVTTLWVWAVGIVSAVARVGETFPRGRATGPAFGERLGVLEFSALGERAVLPVMVVMALLTGVLIGAYARWLGEHPVAVAASGLAGPALVAAAYLFAGPGSGATQRDPYLASLIAVAAGVAVSVLIAVLRRPRPETMPAAPEPTPKPAPAPKAEVTATAPPQGRAAVPSPRGRHDDDYVSWVSQLGDDDGQPTEDLPAPRGRRRSTAAS